MSTADELRDLDARISALRENMRELIEQAAAASGASDEDLSSERISVYEAQLAAAIKQRDALLESRRSKG